jgi:hypothetical protein
MKVKRATETQKDPSYKPKNKLRKGNTYTQSRVKLEEVVNVLSDSYTEEEHELEELAAQELVSRLPQLLELCSAAACTHCLAASPSSALLPLPPMFAAIPVLTCLQALLDFVASQELLLLHLSGLAAPPAAAPTETPFKADTTSAAGGCRQLGRSSSSTCNNHNRPGSSDSMQDSSMTPADAPAPAPVNQQQQQQGDLNLQISSSTVYTSYVARLLQKATPQDVQQVMSMTADDWVQILQDDYVILFCHHCCSWPLMNIPHKVRSC